MLPIRNKSGFVFVFVLYVFTILLVYGMMFALRAVDEWRVADHQRKIAQAFYLAEAAGESALAKLDNFINTDFFFTINSKNPQLIGKKAGNAVKNKQGYSGVDFLVEMAGAGADSFELNDDQTQVIYSFPQTSYGDGIYQYDIVIEENGSVQEVSIEVWEFPYKFSVEAKGSSVSGLSKRLVLQGSFTVQVRRDNFAKYALFTDHHKMKSGGTVWFTDTTNFAGPVHTNERLAFAGDPNLNGLAGIFDGTVTQHLNKAMFYANGWGKLLNADVNGTTDVPVFNEGFSRGYDELVLASSVQKQDLYEQALGSHNPSVGSGIFVASNGGNLTGGIYIDGDATIQMGVDAEDNAQYTIQQGGETKIITVDEANNQTIVLDVGSGESSTYSGVPNGQDDLGTIIYVNGNVTSLGGTIQRDTELTISSETDVVITDHVLYSQYTAAVGNPGDENYSPPSAVDAANLFGVISWGGDIRISTLAPDDLNIHGVMMARNGVFTVDDYDDWSGGRGDVTLLGGVITQFYGPFGLFNGASGQQISGYGRSFNYDERMMQGKSPPYFPTMKTFIGFTDNLTDNVIFWQGSLVQS